jgi:hypothetical protein
VQLEVSASHVADENMTVHYLVVVFSPFCSVHSPCVILRCPLNLHVIKALLPAPQAACRALAQMVAASSDAKQQIMSRIDPDILPWPEVAPIVRQVSWSCCDCAHQQLC